MAAIDRVFTPAVLAAVRSRLKQADHRMRLAYDILTAHGPPPEELGRAWKLKCWRARRAAWEVYLDAADACGLLDAEMMGNLRRFQPDQFRGALGEARACWYLAGKLGYHVTSRPSGRRGHMLDLRVAAHGTELDAEVKSPFVSSYEDKHEIPGLLVSKLRDSSEKFEHGRCNVLVLTPDFASPLHLDRLVLLKAYIGQPVYIVPVALKDDADVPEAYPSFMTDGHLARRQCRDGQFSDPQFTRVSAVLSLEETRHERSRQLFDLDAQMEIQHVALVVHNPFAAVPLPENIFSMLPQLVRRGDAMIWTDAGDTPKTG